MRAELVDAKKFPEKPCPGGKNMILKKTAAVDQYWRDTFEGYSLDSMICFLYLLNFVITQRNTTHTQGFQGQCNLFAK